MAFLSPIYVEVILPIPFGDSFTYLLPENEEGEQLVGKRVIAPFAARKLTGVIVSILEEPKTKHKIRALSRIVDQEPIFSEHNLALIKWVAYYYMCSVGDVLKAALSGKIDVRFADGSWKTSFIQPQLSIIRWAKDPNNEAFIEHIGASISRGVKQRELVEQFRRLATNGTIAKKELLQETGIAQPVLSTLIGKGIFVEEMQSQSSGKKDLSKLTEAQEIAFQQLEVGFQKRNTQLLHGVTASGKTEIYLHLIQAHLERGSQVLFLVPEITLSTQLVHRITDVFGDKVLEYHSKVTDKQRNIVWQRVLNKEAIVVIGARSAVFVPFRNLGFVVVDEEHEAAYKQQEPSPRYNGRDTAIFLASLFKAKVLLGTATPSISSYYNCISDKYGYVKIESRFFKDADLPVVTTEDLNACYKKRSIKNHFSYYLIKAIRENLENGKQVVVFQNRRGYSTFFECKSCGHIPMCRKCNVSLTYHQSSQLLTCHYCGYSERPQTNCTSCGEPKILTKGAGTEKIEEEVQELFPAAKVARIDFDINKKKYAVEEIIRNFEEQNIDILVGTQMIVKGIDFKNVGLVGVLNTDQMLSFPEYWAGERSIQMLTQVAGRAGRRGSGSVILQSHNVDNPVLCAVRDYQYDTWINQELEERQAFNYPPFCRLVSIVFKGKDEASLDRIASAYANVLRPHFNMNLLGPEKPLIDKVHDWYLRKILLKTSKQEGLSAVRHYLYSALGVLKKTESLASVQVIFDVDP